MSDLKVCVGNVHARQFDRDCSAHGQTAQSHSCAQVPAYKQTIAQLQLRKNKQVLLNGCKCIQQPNNISVVWQGWNSTTTGGRTGGTNMDLAVHMQEQWGQHPDLFHAAPRAWQGPCELVVADVQVEEL